MDITVDQIAKQVAGKVHGDGSIKISNAAKIEEAQKGDISFVANGKYESYAYDCKASALLVNTTFDFKNANGKSIIQVENVYEALGILLKKFEGNDHQVSGVSSESNIADDLIYGTGFSLDSNSVISSGVKIGNDVQIASNCYIGEGVTIGDQVILHPGVKIYKGCVIGNQCTIHSNVVIGCDGFGFANKNGKFEKIPQIGNVVIKDHVEIGSNTVIDRATMGSTIIGKGVKLDNLIQVAHNVEIGENTVIAAQTGIAGSTKIGKNCVIGGQVGIVGHISIADGSQIQAQSGISASIKEKNKKWYGFPAISYYKYLRAFSIFKILPTLLRRIESLEEKMEQGKYD